MDKNKLAKAAGIIMFISLISRVIGLLRETLIASSFGTTYQTDSYLMALQIPTILFGIIGVAITTAFIPILSETNKKSGREEMFKFANSVMNLLLIFSVILFVLGFLFTPNLVNILAPKFQGRTKDLTLILTKLSVINLLFLSLNSGYTAILQSMDEFTAPALVGIIMNVPIIVYILIGNKHGVVGLTIATLIGDGLQILIQIPWLIKNKYKYNFKVNLKDERLKRLLFLIGPVIIGTSVNQINTLVQTNMASGLSEGSIAALDYANKLFQMLYFTFAAAIVTVIFPALSREGRSTDFTIFKEHINNAVNNINLIIMPTSLALMILRIPIISLLFKHGAFDQRALEITSQALLFLTIGMVFWGVRDVFNRAFYAIQDTKTPMKNGALGVIFNIILSIILVKLMGIGGLTLATSLSAMFCCILLIKDLRKKIGEVNGMKILSSSIKIFAAALIMGVIIFIIDFTMKAHVTSIKTEIIELGICTITGIITYSIMLWLLKVKEFMNIISVIKIRFSKTQMELERRCCY